MTHQLASPGQPRRVVDGRRVGQFPHEVVGDQRLPLRGIADEHLNVPRSDDISAYNAIAATVMEENNGGGRPPRSHSAPLTRTSAAQGRTFPAVRL